MEGANDTTVSTYRDVIERMERNGDYGEADSYRRALEHHGHSEWDSVDRFDVADGAAHTYAGDRAEEAFRDIQRDERHREELRAEEQEQERKHFEQMRRQAEQEQYPLEEMEQP